MRTLLQRRSLRAKIIIWSLIPTVIILSAVALVSIYAYQRGAEDLVIQRNQELARLHAGQVAAEMNGYVNTLNAVARISDIYEGRPASQQMALLQASNRLVVFDAGVVVLNNYGVVVAAQPARPDTLGADWSMHPYFRQMVRTPAAVFSDITPDGANGQQVIVVAVPISGARGEFVGALAAMFRLRAQTVSAFYGSLVKLRIAPGATAYLVDRNGLVLYHSDLERVGEDFSAVESVKKVIGGTVAALRTRDVAGYDIVSSFSPVPGLPWGLVTEERWDVVMQPNQGARQFLQFLLLLGVAIPSLFVAVAVGRISKPVQDLIIAAKEVAAGNFGRTISAPTGDEIEELANQFNIMSAELQESYTNLERRVADRTRALEALHDISTVVSGTLDVEQVLEVALDKTMAVVGTELGGAYSVDEERQVVDLIAQRGLSDGFVAYVKHMPLATAMAGRPLLGDQPVVWSMAEYPESEMKAYLARAGVNLILAIPLAAKGRVLGFLVCSTQSARIVTAEERSLLASIGRQVGMAMENARLYRQAEETAVSAERQRLGRELHDAVTQTLFSASLIADVLPRLAERNPAEAKRRIAELRDLTRGALAEMRTLLHELRPASLIEMSLGDLLRQLGEATTGRARVPVTVDASNLCPLDPGVQVALYRIAQEALNNVAKYANATQVRVLLACSADESDKQIITLSVSDNGCGFNPSALAPTGHLGLGIMEERAAGISATLNVDSSPGHGTRVIVRWSESAWAESKKKGGT